MLCLETEDEDAGRERGQHLIRGCLALMEHQFEGTVSVTSRSRL